MSRYLALHDDNTITVHADAYYPLTDTYLPAWAEAWGMWETAHDDSPSTSVVLVAEDPRLYNPSIFHSPWEPGDELRRGTMLHTMLLNATR